MKAFLILSLATCCAMAADSNQPPARPGLEIKSRFAEFRLKENVAYYSNNVVVVDPPAKPGDPPTIIHCHELTATRNASGKPDKIIADGRVEIDQGETYHARGNHAIYTATNEWMVLTGAYDPADKNLRRPYLYSSQGTNHADEIVYDRLNDKMFFKEVSTYIPGSALKNTNSPAGATNKPQTKTQNPPPN
jgi:lipopolysaccharide export system protein LptA